MNNFSVSSSGNFFFILLPAVFLFIFAAAFNWVMGPVFLVLLPMILFINCTVNGMLKTSAVFFASYFLLLIMAVWLHWEVWAIAVLTTGAAGIFMAQCAGKNFSVEKTIIYPALFIIGAVCFNFIYDAMALSANPWQYVKDYITAGVKEFIKQSSQLSLNSEYLNIIKDNEKNIIEGFIQTFPSMVIILSGLIIWANLLLAKNYLLKAGIVYPRLIALARWKAPDYIIWFFIASGLLYLVWINDIKIIGLNAFLIVCFIYFLQGLAIISFLFQNKNVPPFFRYLFYFFIAVQQLLMIPIVAIGLFDIWVDFRKLFQKDQTTN